MCVATLVKLIKRAGNKLVERVQLDRMPTRMILDLFAFDIEYAFRKAIQAAIERPDHENSTNENAHLDSNRKVGGSQKMRTKTDDTP
jgi:hypothetical protein